MKQTEYATCVKMGRTRRLVGSLRGTPPPEKQKDRATQIFMRGHREAWVPAVVLVPVSTRSSETQCLADPLT